MSIQLRFFLILFSILFFFFVLLNIKKSKMSLDSASLWVLWSLGVILIAFFPEIITWISHILGIAAPMNTVFLVMIFLLYVLVFFSYVKLSLLEDKLKNLIQRLGIEENEKHHE